MTDFVTAKKAREKVVAQYLKCGVHTIACKHRVTLEETQELLAEKLSCGVSNIKNWTYKAAPATTYQSELFFGLVWLILDCEYLGLIWLTELLDETDVFDAYPGKFTTKVLRKLFKNALVDGKRLPDAEIDRLVSRVFKGKATNTISPSDNEVPFISQNMVALAMLAINVLGWLATIFFVWGAG